MHHLAPSPVLHTGGGTDTEQLSSGTVSPLCEGLHGLTNKLIRTGDLVDVDLQLLRIYAGKHMSVSSSGSALGHLLAAGGYTREVLDTRPAWLLAAVLTAVGALPEADSTSPQVLLEAVTRATPKHHTVLRRYYIVTQEKRLFYQFTWLPRNVTGFSKFALGQKITDQRDALRVMSSKLCRMNNCKWYAKRSAKAGMLAKSTIEVLGRWPKWNTQTPFSHQIWVLHPSAGSNGR